MYRVIYTQRAKIELQNSYNYIYFNLANSIAARKFKVNIIKSISNLEYFPYMGKKVLNSNLRFIRFKNYSIFYSINNQNVMNMLPYKYFFSKIFIKKIELFVDTVFKRIAENSFGSTEYITGGLDYIGFHVMRSLRDTEKNLIVEVN